MRANITNLSTIVQVLTYTILAVLGLFVGLLTSFYSAKRSQRQPVVFNLASENALLNLILKDPTLFLRLGELKPSDFAFPAHVTLYRELQEFYNTLPYFKPSELTEENIDASCAIFLNELENDTNAVNSLASIRETFSETLKIEEANLVKIKKQPALDTALTDKDYALKCASEILSDSQDRTYYNGKSEVVVSNTDPAIPLVRRYIKPSLLRLIASGVYGALVVPLSLFFASNSPYDDSSFVYVFMAFVLLSFFTLLWALVDIDTMYLDMKSFYVGLPLIYVTCLAAGLASNKPSMVLPGLVIAGGGFIVFEVSNFLYKVLRGRDGIGQGDSLILLASAGAPAALFSSWILGYYSMLFAFILGLIGWGFMFILRKVSKDSPFAFGPYLAFGWIVATLFFVYGDGLSL